MPAEEVESTLGETIDRVRRIIIRGRWWILGTACFTTLATVAVLSRLANLYTSEATLLVVQQQIPERYVVPNSTADVASALQAMKQEVLSRTQLLKIINDFGLYPKAVKRLATEEVVALMLKDIDILPIENPQRRDKDLTAFRISFTAEDPVMAQRVASTLTSLFIEENLKTREAQSTSTTKFLNEAMNVAQKKLSEQEQRLRDFKMQYLGELPEQQSGNLGILTSLQSQLQNTMGSMSRAQEQRVYMESLLSGYVALSARNVPLPASSTPAAPEVSRSVSPVDAAQRDLTRLQTERETLLRLYTSRHPDVLKLDRDIAAAEAVLERLKASAPKVDKSIAQGTEKTEGQKIESPAVAAASTVDQPAVAQIKSQLEANRLEMKNLSLEEEHLKGALKQYQDRLNLTPVREQQLTGLLRDYDLQKKDYSDLLSKVQQSELATNLEKNQRGQQFRLIDPPSLPAVPSSPNRIKINLGGIAGGIFLGLALAFLTDLKVRSFHNEKELSQFFGLPLVVGVPMLLTPTEKRARTWTGVLECFAGCVLVLIVFAAEFYSYRRL